MKTSIFCSEIFSGVRSLTDRTPEIVGRPSDKICALENSPKTKYLEIPIQIQISGPLGIFHDCKTGPIKIRKTLSYRFMYALYDSGVFFCIFINFLRLKMPKGQIIDLPQTHSKGYPHDMCHLFLTRHCSRGDVILQLEVNHSSFRAVPVALIVFVAAQLLMLLYCDTRVL